MEAPSAFPSALRGTIHTNTPILASDLLQRLHDEAPTYHFTTWLLGTLHRSFGATLLICAVVAIAPGISK
jgi:hypothetical protein